MVDTWSVSDDQGWSRICLCLCNCFHCLVEICTHCDLCNIYITIAHSNSCKVFLLRLFTTGRELCCCTCLSSFWRLSACVGVNFCIKYHDVDILTACQYVVNSTESDIVSPSVTTEDPLGFLRKEVFIFQQFCSLSTSAVTVFQSFYKLVCSCSVCCTYWECIQIFLSCCFHIIVCTVLYKFLYRCFESFTDRILCKKHTISKLCVILKQWVRPCRTSSLWVYCIRCRRWRVTPDRRTSCCICNVHSVTE